MSKDDYGHDSARLDANIIILVACIALINSEQNLLAPNMSAVAASFGMNDTEKDEKLGGGLAAALFLVGAPAALLVGMAADGCARRVDLLVLVLVIGALGCGASAISISYSQLFVARALTGVSLGSAMPLAFSLIGDMAGPAQRTAISGRLGVAMSIGAACGQGLAGFAGPSLGWRAPFICVAAAMLLLTVIVRARMREPPRPLKPGGTTGGSTSWRAWARVFSVGSVRLIFAQGIPGCVPWGVIGAFLPDYLHADAGFSVPHATLVMSGFSLGACLGTFCGGELGQSCYNRDRRRPALLMLVAGSGGVLPMWLLIAHTPSTLAACALLASCGGFLATQTGPNVRATLTNVTQPDQRGFAFATFALCDDLGRGAGPVLIAYAIRRWGRRATFAWAMFWWIPCALLCGATALTVGADERRAQKGQQVLLTHKV